MTSEKAVQPTLETILRPGQTVAGKYCVDHLIAAGGMAAVWAGINLRTGKRVALKVILRSFASTPGAEELFRREALAASRVNHPNVVTVFDVVDHASRTCIVMEYLDGEDLGAYFQRQGSLGLEEAVALLLPAMRGVAAANAQGVVHRDLKPKNIFLCIGPDGRLITTKILDFGISVIAEKASEPRSKTVQLTTHGTPSYMSPEHITGSPNIDERADVYGFGVILFEALAGQAPFVGPAGTELLMRILQEPTPKLTRFRPDLSPELDAIIEKALAKTPDDRYPTLNHFIVALEDHALPRSPIVRSLTPVVGVPILDSGSGPRGLADPVVRIVRREPSGEHDDGKTKGLYTLSRAATSKKGDDRSRPSSTENVVPAPARTDEPSLKPQSAAPAPADERVRRSSENTASSRQVRSPIHTSAAERARNAPGDDDTASLMLAVERRFRMWRLLAVAAVVGASSVFVAWRIIPSQHDLRKTSAAQTASAPIQPVTRTAVGALPPFAPLEESLDTTRADQPPVLDEVPSERPSLSIPGAVPRNETAQRAARGAETRGAERGKAGTNDRHSRQSRTSETARAPMALPLIPPPPPLPTPPEAPPRRAGQLSTDDF